MASRAPRRFVRFLAVGALAVALVGCSGGDVLETGAAVRGDVGGAVQAAATPVFLRESAERTVAVETGKVDIVTTISGGGQAATLASTTVFDTTRPAASTVVTSDGDDLPGLNGVELVYDGGVVYLKAGFATALGATSDASWVSFPADEPGELDAIVPGGVLTDPAALLAELREQDFKVTEVGREDVRGVATTHYAIALPPEQASLPGVTGATGDVWIDDDGIVRRVRSELTGSVAMSITAELYDLGESVTIAVPPADQVTPLDAHRVNAPNSSSRLPRSRAATAASSHWRRSNERVSRSCSRSRAGTSSRSSTRR
jgi:hypothetical protein